MMARELFTQFFSGSIAMSAMPARDLRNTLRNIEAKSKYTLHIACNFNVLFYGILDTDEIGTSHWYIRGVLLRKGALGVSGVLADEVRSPPCGLLARKGSANCVHSFDFSLPQVSERWLVLILVEIMSFLKRLHNEDNDTDDGTIDPELRLRTVRTAASAIAESIKSEQRAEKRKMQRKKSRFFRSLSERRRPHTAASAQPTATPPDSSHIPGVRRNVYVNRPLLPIDLGPDGEPLARYVRNKVRTSSTYHCPRFCSAPLAHQFTEYTIVTFIPKNLYEQFRRYAFRTPSPSHTPYQT
jgi:hypothetical protein